MSFADQVIQDNPDKYESLLEARILGRQLQLKLNQYKALQNQYDLLLQIKNNNRKRSTGGWKQINGKLKQISAVGKDWLWGVNNSNQIFTCKKPCNDSSWINIPGRLSQLEGGESEVWGVNAADNIFKMNVDHSNGWRQISGKLSNISQGGGWVWGINRNNYVYRCQQPCNGNWILDTRPTGQTSLVQLSCSSTHVYALDKNENAWRKSVNGSGKWANFGTPPTAKFRMINASNPNKVLAVGMNREIYTTDKDGTQEWHRADNVANGLTNVSGDPENANYYVTNTSNDIYRHEPVEQGGNWRDLNNENYQMGMVSSPTQTSDDWKFLGKSDTLNDCKLKAVQDDAATFSSVVYYPSDFGNDWSKSCFGGIKGKNINSGYQLKTITSLPPNGTTALGGDEGEKIAKQMKTLQNQIKKIIKKIQKSGKGLDKTKTLLSGETVSKSEELEKLLVKMENDRREIDTLLRQPDELAGEEDSNIRQISSYTTFSLWLLLGLVSIYMAYYVYSREIYEISMAVYVFIAIWILIIGKYYYRTVIDYGESSWKFISYMLPSTSVF